jgi:hypothetical protein
MSTRFEDAKLTNQNVLLLPGRAPSKLPKKIFEKFDSAHSSSVRPSNINGSGFGAEQALKAQPHRPATPEEEYEHAFACEYNCGFYSESFAECSEHETTCNAKPAEPANKTSPSNTAPTPSVASADGPSPVDSQVKALVEVQQRLDKAAKQPAVVDQTAAASSTVSGPSGGSEREGGGAGSGQGGVGADELPLPQSTLRDLAENQIRNEQENKGSWAGEMSEATHDSEIVGYAVCLLFIDQQLKIRMHLQRRAA